MQKADLILHNGQVVTLDNASRTHEAIAVTGSYITAVGNSDNILRDTGRDTRVIDLDGRSACPGRHSVV